MLVFIYACLLTSLFSLAAGCGTPSVNLSPMTKSGDAYYLPKGSPCPGAVPDCAMSTTPNTLPWDVYLNLCADAEPAQSFGDVSQCPGMMGCQSWGKMFNSSAGLGKTTACTYTDMTGSQQGVNVYCPGGNSYSDPMSGAMIERQLQLLLLCDPTKPGSSAAMSAEIQMTSAKVYQFTWSRPEFCSGSSGPGGRAGGLGGGAIFLIILVVVALVYLLVGAIYLKFVKKEAGGVTNLILFKDRWAALIGYAKDGCTFTFSKIFRRGGGAYTTV